jgi:hypothetical protein
MWKQWTLEKIYLQNSIWVYIKQNFIQISKPFEKFRGKKFLWKMSRPKTFAQMNKRWRTRYSFPSLFGQKFFCSFQGFCFLQQTMRFLSHILNKKKLFFKVELELFQTLALKKLLCFQVLIFCCMYFHKTAFKIKPCLRKSFAPFNQRPNSWTILGQKFSSLLFTVTSTNGYYSPLETKMVWNRFVM